MKPVTSKVEPVRAVSFLFSVSANQNVIAVTINEERSERVSQIVMPHKKCTSRTPLTENLATPHATFTHLDILGEYRYALVECLPDESKIALSCCRALS